MWASTQGIFGVREELAQELKVPASRVRVLCEYMGGGFGAKFGARVDEGQLRFDPPEGGKP